MTALVLLSQWMESQVEFWRPIEGSRGYDVSNFGRVRSYWMRKRKSTIGATPHFMRAAINGNYPMIVLRDNKKRLVHRLVARSFIPNPSNLPTVNHISGYRVDSRSDGLEWATHFDNHQHAMRNGLHAWGTRNRHAVLTESQVLEIRQRLANKEKQSKIAERFGVSRPTISAISTGRLWRHLIG